MKRQLFTVAVLAALTCLGAYAETKLQADIPFNFSMGDRVLPAGEYRIVLDHGVLTMREAKGGRAAMALATQNHAIQPGKNTAGDAVLFFQRYGNEYFLSGLWTRDSTGLGVPKSVRQKELARSMNSSEPTTIALTK
jgi:hypothetical protein